MGRTLISVLNDDLFSSFDRRRSDGKVEQGNDYTFARRARAVSSFRGPRNSICSAPDVAHDKCEKMNELRPC